MSDATNDSAGYRCTAASADLTFTGPTTAVGTATMLANSHVGGRDTSDAVEHARTTRARARA